MLARSAPTTAASTAASSGFRAASRSRATRDLLATALREAEEEVGLAPAHGRGRSPRSTRSRRSTPAGASIPFLGRIPADTAWRLQQAEIVGILTPAVARARRSGGRAATLPFTSRRFPEPLDVDGIDVEGHVLWGMTLRLLDDLVPRLLAGEWDV